MELEKLMEIRRSVRAYDETKEVTKEQVETMIRAAQLAPSWKNSQPGRYYALLTKDYLEKVRQLGLPDFNQKNSANAALIVTTFVKGESGFMNGTPANEMGDEWGAYDLGLQNAYMILKASELGLDTLIMGIRDSAALRAELNIPENEEIAAVIAVGYRAVEPHFNPRKDLDEILKIF